MAENDRSLEERLGAMLSDPNAMNSIMSIVKGLGGTQNNKADQLVQKSEPQLPSNEDIPAMALPKASFESENKSLALLLALKPFLSHERARKLDTLTGLLRVLSITDFLR